MIELTLLHGVISIIDDVDSDLANYKWSSNRGGYARSAKLGLMHRVICIRMGLEYEWGMVTDHINRNKLDNTRSNLRVVSQSVNARNCVHPLGKSGHRGVSYNAKFNKWTAYLSRGRNILLGHFDTIEEACAAYKKAADEEDAKLSREQGVIIYK